MTTSRGGPQEPARILVVDDEPHLLRALSLTLRQAGYQGVVTESDAEAALRHVQTRPWDLVLLDLNMPRVHGLDILRALTKEQPNTPCVVVTAVDQAATAIEALRAGAFDYLTKATEPAQLLAAVERALGSATTDADLEHPEAFADIITASPKMHALFRYLERVARAEDCVLVRGPTGSGKELIAQAIHRLSRHRDGPFLGFNVAALPASLFAAQLFGHTAGAYSGATGASQGLFGAAAAGSLFMDEVGALDLSLQASLLRVLQEREYFRLGETAPRFLEARLIFATNRDLEAEAAAGRFRRDLYHRISSISVRVPGLAERPEDVPPLVEHFAARLARDLARPVIGVHPETLEILSACPLPGNVRELENVVREAVLREESSHLRPSSLPEAYRVPPRRLSGEGDLRPLAVLEREHIERVLEATGGNVTQAAEVLGISRATLNRRLKAYRGVP